MKIYSHNFLIKLSVLLLLFSYTGTELKAVTYEEIKNYSKTLSKTSSKAPKVLGTSTEQNSTLKDFCIGPTVVITPQELKPVVGNIIDAPLVPITTNGQRQWLVNGQLGFDESKMAGSIDRPFTTNVWGRGKGVDEFFPNWRSNMPVVVNGETYTTAPWLVNAYEAPDGILGFVHIEAYKDSNNWAGRVGLAWSDNGGETFKYLGHIIQMDMTRSVEPGTEDLSNIQGVPYFVAPENPQYPVSDANPEYFYIYYMERGHSHVAGVARAKVSDVLFAARSGEVSPWKKYYNGYYSQPGLRGKATPTNLGGTNHSDAVFNPTTGKAYYVQTSRIGQSGSGTSVQLLESTDFVNWNYKSLIDFKPTNWGTDSEGKPVSLDKPGYQYATIINPNGKEDGKINEEFDIIAIKNYQQSEGPYAYSALRWHINLNSPSTICRETASAPLSGDFIYNGKAYYSSGTAYCQRSRKISTSGFQTIQILPGNQANHGVCGPAISEQDFRIEPLTNNGTIYSTLFHSFGNTYCEYTQFNQNIDNGVAEVYWAIPSVMTKSQSYCPTVVPKIIGNFNFFGSYYFSNGKAFCKYSKISSNEIFQNFNYLPSDQDDHGVCGPAIPAGNFRVNDVLYYSNTKGYCQYQNQNADGRTAVWYLAIPSVMENYGICSGG